MTKKAGNEAQEEEIEEILDNCENIISQGNISFRSIKRPCSDEFHNAQYVMRIKEKENKPLGEGDPNNNKNIPL